MAPRPELRQRMRRAGEGARRMAGRVRGYAPSLLLAAAAAGIAYLVAGLLFGADQAVFAPVAAVVATGLSAGQRRRRAIEISIGVVLGIMAADLLSRWLGTGAWQLALAVLLAMTAAVAFRASVLLTNQAAVAATVVMTLVPLLDSSPWLRLGDALVGGAVAIVLTALLAPDPVRGATAAVDQVLASFASGLRELRAALRDGSLAGAESALAGMEAMAGARQELAEAIGASRERIRLGRTGARRAQRRRMLLVERVAARIELLLSSGRALCRAGASLVRHGEAVDAALADAVGGLAEALDEARRWARDGGGPHDVRRLALAAAVTASAARDAPQPPAVSALIGQLRSAVVDVLRITGLEQQEAVAMLERAAGRSDRRGDDPAPG